MSIDAEAEEKMFPSITLMQKIKDYQDNMLDSNLREKLMDFPAILNGNTVLPVPVDYFDEDNLSWEEQDEEDYSGGFVDGGIEFLAFY